MGAVGGASLPPGTCHRDRIRAGCAGQNSNRLGAGSLTILILRVTLVTFSTFNYKLVSVIGEVSGFRGVSSFHEILDPGRTGM